MPGLGVMAFSKDNGYFLDTNKNISCPNMPSGIQKIMNGNIKAVTCVALGTGSNWFCAWEDENNKRFWNEVVNEYPALSAYLNDEERKKKYKFDKFHVSLGANGAWYVNNEGAGQNYHGLDKGLSQEISRRLTPNHTWNSDPMHVTLGCDGSYVLIGKKGDVVWDLKGHYSGLDDILRESKTGIKASTNQSTLPILYNVLCTKVNLIKNVTLSPFSSTRYYVVFNNGGSRWFGPRSWDLKLD